LKKSKNPGCFKGVRGLPVDYYSNKNAWMTNFIFNDWLGKWNLELKRKIVLLVDNSTAHTNNSLLKNIKVIFLPADTTSLIQPCDQCIIRAFKAHYSREMRARITAELDEIQDRSDASAVAKNRSFLDALHLVAMSWKRVSEKTIKNCFRKGGFSKTNTETHASEKSDIASEIFDQAPDGMPIEEFENWLDIDNNAEIVTTMTVPEICQAAADDKSKLAEER
jgi:hypothetical protein